MTPREHMMILARIVAATAAVCATTPTAVYSETRMADTVKARMVTCWLAGEMTQLGASAVARMLGRDHTTVLNARRKVAAAMTAKAGQLYEIATATIELLQRQARQEHAAA